jgi:class 3 adenylate cyclase/HAMP domain-containing protein
MKNPFAPLRNWVAGRIKNKILFSVLAVFLVLYGGTLSYIYDIIRDDVLEVARRNALQDTRKLAWMLYRNYEDLEDARAYHRELETFLEIQTNLLEINVVNRELSIVGGTNFELIFETVSEDRYRQALQNRETLFMHLGGVAGTVDERPYINVVYPIAANAGVKVEGVRGAVETRYSLQQELADLAEIRNDTIGAGLAIMIAIAIAVTTISQSITRPIQDLYVGMEKANDGDLNIRVPVVGRDEIGYLTTTFNDMIDSIRKSNERILAILDSTRRFVPDQFLSALGRGDITAVELGDSIHRDMTVFFMDIRKFSTLSEQMSADDVLTFINALLEDVLPAIEQHNGFIDKYIGDAVMALFPGRPDDALLAAVDLRQRLVVFNKVREGRGKEAINVGIGINSGDLILGTLGSPTRIDTTVIGDTVNVASRLESLTKEYEVPVILPEEVFLSMAESTRARVQVRELGTVKIRGIENARSLVGVTG